MEIKSVILRGWNRDEGYKLLINGEEIASTNHDEHGSAGIDLLQQVHDGLARMAGIYPVREDGLEDEDEAQ